MKKGLLNLSMARNSFWDSAIPDSNMKSHYLVRDFIHTCLYGTAGYFTSHASILSPDPYDYKSFKDQDAFLSQIGKSYSAESGQIWHTPCEIFKPWFGSCIAEYLVKKRKSDKIIIYEMGAGNGTLMFDILDLIRARYPLLYANLEYNIIEISPRLVEILKEKSKNHHSDKINIKQISIFDWDQFEERECFFLGMEVIDNFAHDVIRYDFNTLEPLQAHVIESVSNELSEIYTPVTDSLIKRFLDLRSKTEHSSLNSWKRNLSRFIPFAPSMTQKEFIPTKSLEFLEIMVKFFPNHSLLLSDFTKLDRCVPGKCGPVVQTMVDGVMLPCTTYLVIFFKTNSS